VIWVFLEGEKLVPREVRTVVNTLIRAVSFERHCSGEELSMLGSVISSVPVSSWEKGGKTERIRRDEWVGKHSNMLIAFRTK